MNEKITVNMASCKRVFLELVTPMRYESACNQATEFCTFKSLWPSAAPWMRLYGIKDTSK